jgi:penicillin-binding protein 1A
MNGVVVSGTGVNANVSEFAAGKTGTTENYGDAWFVGFTDKYTVAVWVGYPDRVKYMETEYAGGPVAGGTYPAEIWHDFMTSAISIDDARNPDDEDEETVAPVAPAPVPEAPVAPEPVAPAEEAPVTPENSGGAPPAPEPAPTPEPAPAPQPAPQAPPGGADGGAGAGTG